MLLCVLAYVVFCKLCCIVRDDFADPHRLRSLTVGLLDVQVINAWSGFHREGQGTQIIFVQSFVLCCSVEENAARCRGSK
jgi:hypothetical protein